MPLTLDSSDQLTLDLFRQVAWDGTSLTPSPLLARSMDRRREQFLSYLAANGRRRFYGINTKHHTGAKTLLDDEARTEYAQRLPSTPPSIGARLPERVVRGILLARMTDVVNGTAPLRADTAARILRMLDAPLPPVPARGAGEPGDIIPLGHLFRGFFDGTLEIGEGMALINGSPVATAVLCDGALQGRDRVTRTEAVLALAAAAAGAPADHFAASVQEQWRDPHAARAMAAIREWTAGSDPDSQLPYQAPVSFRSGPRLLTWMRRAQAQAEECADIALQSSSNNPIFLGPDQAPPLGSISSNGGYHNPWATPCLDALARSWADLALLSASQVGRLIDDPRGIVSAETESYLSGFYMSAAGWAEEARSHASTTLIGVAGGGQTDTGTHDLLAWRKATDAGEAMDATTAILGVIAAHTLLAKGWAAPPALADLLTGILDAFPPRTPPLEFGSKLENVRELLSRSAPLEHPRKSHPPMSE